MPKMVLKFATEQNIDFGHIVHRIPKKFEEFTQKYHSEIEKTSLSTHIVQIYSLTVAFLTW